MDPSLRQLRYLVAVAETGSISAAARSLWLTQPAVTTALRNLEQNVGVSLLVRHRQGIDLTPAGAAFVASARHALEQIDEATVSARRATAAIEGGRLTLGFLPATFSRLPRTIIGAFREQHPSVMINYHELSYIGHTSELVTGRVDVAFLWPPYDEPDLHFHVLSHEERVVGVADSHPLASYDEVTLDDILDLHFPGYHRSSSGGWFTSWFFDDLREAPAVLTSDEAATPYEMAIPVIEGRAIAPAAESFARAFPIDGVRWLPIADAPSATLAIACRRRSPNPVTSAFVRVARALIELEGPLGAGAPRAHEPVASRLLLHGTSGGAPPDQGPASR